jgi:AcrR family transcriptional regulator
MSPRRPNDVEGLRADLLGHARTVIARDGIDGLTMRALATQSGTAVGLSYKAFSSRDDLVWKLTWTALRDLAQQLDEWAASPAGELADRLMLFHDLHQGSLAPVLVEHISRGPRREELFRRAADAGFIRSWTGIMTEFLRTRQRMGDVRDDVDVEAFAFMISAALHHVLVTEKPFLVADRPTLAEYVAGIAAGIKTRTTASE